MPVIVKSLGDYLKVIVQAFNLSSTFPALIFVLIAQGLLLPLLPSRSFIRIDELSDTSARTAAILLVTALLAYLLDAANLKIIRLFEGYKIEAWLPFKQVKDWNVRYVEQSQSTIRKLEQLSDRLMDEAEKEQDETRKKELLRLANEATIKLVQLVEQTTLSYPEDPDYVLCSPFGNVIAAAEHYPRKTFGMDTVTLWPFLIPILTEKNYAPVVSRTRAVMDFLVNLTVIFGILAGLIAVFAWLPTRRQEYAIETTLLALGAVCCFYLSIQAAASWGSTVRAAFVLFREDLRVALRLRTVKSYREERDLWAACSSFLNAQGSDQEQLHWGRDIFNAASYARVKPKQGKIS